MRVRRFVIAVGAVVLLATGMVQPSGARADEVIDYDVGGGAAIVQLEVDAQQYDLFPTLFDGADRIVYGNAVNGVKIGKNGGNKTAKFVNQKVGTLGTIKSGYATIKGNRGGTPFAEARTVLKGVKIQGTNIAAIDTYCKWDKFGEPTGRVLVTDAGGQTFEPAPNTEIPLPGIGTLVLNEQYIEDRWILTDSIGNYVIQSVIYINAARITLDPDYEPLGFDLYGDVILGFTSCDPIKLPNLSGLTLVSSPT